MSQVPAKHEYLLFPWYRKRPLRHPVDIHALLRLAGAVVVPHPQGFVCTDERLSGGHSLWRFLVQCLGETCLGRSRADETGTWRSMTRALSQLGDKNPALLNELVGATRWERECRTSKYPIRVPRGAPEVVNVIGTCLVGITLRDPADPGCQLALERAVAGVVANQMRFSTRAGGSEAGSVTSGGGGGGGGAGAAIPLPPDSDDDEEFPLDKVFPHVWAAYEQLWASHEAVDLTRVVCVHNRLGGDKGKRRKLWRNQGGSGEPAAAALTAEPLHALAAAATSVTIAPGVLAGYYTPLNTHTGGTGVDAIAFLRLIGAVTVMAPGSFLVTDATKTGGHSLYTFIVRILGPQCLGAKPLTEANTWFALAKAITRLKGKDPAFVENILGGKSWSRECTVRPHPIMIPRGAPALPPQLQQPSEDPQLKPEATDAATATVPAPAPARDTSSPRAPDITASASSASSSDSTISDGPPTAPAIAIAPAPGPPTHDAAATATTTAAAAAAGSSDLEGGKTSGYATVWGTFLLGIQLRDPDDPSMEQDLAYAIAYVAPLFPLQERLPEVLDEYRRLWASHDCLPLSLLKADNKRQQHQQQYQQQGQMGQQQEQEQAPPPPPPPQQQQQQAEQHGMDGGKQQPAAVAAAPGPGQKKRVRAGKAKGGGQEGGSGGGGRGRKRKGSSSAAAGAAGGLKGELPFPYAEYPPPPLRHHPDGRPFVDLPPTVHPMPMAMQPPLALPPPPHGGGYGGGEGGGDADVKSPPPPGEPTITVQEDEATADERGNGGRRGGGTTLYAV